MPASATRKVSKRRLQVRQLLRRFLLAVPPMRVHDSLNRHRQYHGPPIPTVATLRSSRENTLAVRRQIPYGHDARLWIPSALVSTGVSL